ncbi:hypothetical protein BDZ97DRAFT_1911995 [Flammula alnicola]|nr:hypothetical protein BDZ97DRAFT_1911995 [Flammula alnicola]
MPPRRKPTSTRQKKADQQLKRAIKRGDVPPPEVKKTPHHRKPRLGPTGHVIGASDTSAVESARKLQADEYIASNLSLSRPISYEQAIFHSFDHDGDPDIEALSCPKRPKWRFDMSKLEVERNEEGYFKKWLAQTDEALKKWQNKSLAAVMARYRNLQIILVLLDSRCSTLHYPPSLSTYLGDRKSYLSSLKSISQDRPCTSMDQVYPRPAPKVRIVQVESYIEKESRMEHQGRKQYEPSIPEHFRAMLVQVIKEVHAEMLEPPEKVKNNPNWLKNWIPQVKRDIDWEGVMQAKGSKVGLAVGGATVPKPLDDDSGQPDLPENPDHRQEPSYLTIGLIGQPNVGKSSLLNALFGTRKVRASKTPGKTKHFQTLYWTPDVRLVDCPGLVMPNYVPMEMQVLSGILPISRVSAVPSCIHYTSQLLPLERIFKLVHPSTRLAPVEDKRTWRDDRKPEEQTGSSNPPAWTAMDILTAYADAKGWVTAQAGRPDVHRAGNALLRAVAEGRVGWGFWPPGTPLDQIAAGGGEGQGIWIPHGDRVDQESEPESEGEEENLGRSSESEDEGIEEEEEEEDSGNASSVGIGRFGVLAVNDTGEDDEDSSEESCG